MKGQINSSTISFHDAVVITNQDCEMKWESEQDEAEGQEKSDPDEPKQSLLCKCSFYGDCSG